MTTFNYDVLPSDLQDIVDTANDVLNTWETSDLDIAVQNLDATLRAYDLRDEGESTQVLT